MKNIIIILILLTIIFICSYLLKIKIKIIKENFYSKSYDNTNYYLHNDTLQNKTIKVIENKLNDNTKLINKISYNKNKINANINKINRENNKLIIKLNKLIDIANRRL
jgi:5-bromo-4-chloroindolyl phosphate hydrolysis protein